MQQRWQKHLSRGRILAVALALSLPLSMGYNWLAYRSFPPIIWPLPSPDQVERDYSNSDHAFEVTTIRFEDRRGPAQP